MFPYYSVAVPTSGTVVSYARIVEFAATLRLTFQLQQQEKYPHAPDELPKGQ